MSAASSLSGDDEGVRAAAARAAREDSRSFLRAGVSERAPEYARRWRALPPGVGTPTSGDCELRNGELAAR
eukprot:5086534-Pyramimonas_sp.AAC.1